MRPPLSDPRRKLLAEVSRSFYLTLRMLPSSVQPQIGLAYLLARLTDTVADTELVPPDERIRALEHYRQRILGQAAPAFDAARLAGHHGSSGERELLERADEVIALLDTLDQADRTRVRSVLDVIASGQRLDVERFGSAAAGKLRALASDEELEDYLYRVAGCVGEFWTVMCRAHVFPHAPLDDAALVADGVRFGKGLQLVNVLRDLASDLRLGRCYVPRAALVQARLTPESLLDPAAMPVFRPAYDLYLDRAEQHLRAGWRYTLTLPWRHGRLRLACAWPILIGRQTLAPLRVVNPLRPDVRIKVRRAAVWGMVVKTLLLYPIPAWWNRLGTQDPMTDDRLR
jgi:farnesyl-diphosphate farnesyltransferase